jgi:hypothetical protein
MRMTSAEYLAYEARRRPQAAATQGCEDEAELHESIRQECGRQGWLVFHGSMAHSTFRTEGEPDFVILAPGHTLLIECKTRTGKLSTAQRAVHAWARNLGHTVYVVRSMEEFYSVLRDLNL